MPRRRFGSSKEKGGEVSPTIAIFVKGEEGRRGNRCLREHPAPPDRTKEKWWGILFPIEKKEKKEERPLKLCTLRSLQNRGGSHLAIFPQERKRKRIRNSLPLGEVLLGGGNLGTRCSITRKTKRGKRRKNEMRYPFSSPGGKSSFVSLEGGRRKNTSCI